MGPAVAAAIRRFHGGGEGILAILNPAPQSQLKSPFPSSRPPLPCLATAALAL